MTKTEAVHLAKILKPSDELWNYEKTPLFYCIRIQEILVQRLKGNVPKHGYTPREKTDWMSDKFVEGYANAHKADWEIDWATAPAESLSEVEQVLNIEHISLDCLDLISFLLNHVSRSAILEGNMQAIFGGDESDWIGDELRGYGLDKKALLLCIQYIARTISDLEQPISDEKYDKENFLDGMSVSSWCETLFDSLNLFELAEENYYATFAYWLSFLTSYSGSSSGTFWCFNWKTRIIEYTTWRSYNPKRKNEIFKALDKAVSVLLNPFLTDEAWCVSRNETVSMLFTIDAGVECINPFLPYAQEIFDSLYPEFLKIKSKI